MYVDKDHMVPDDGKLHQRKQTFKNDLMGKCGSARALNVFDEWEAVAEICRFSKKTSKWQGEEGGDQKERKRERERGSKVRKVGEVIWHRKEKGGGSKRRTVMYSQVTKKSSKRRWGKPELDFSEIYIHMTGRWGFEQTGISIDGTFQPIRIHGQKVTSDCAFAKMFDICATLTFQNHRNLSMASIWNAFDARFI